MDAESAPADRAERLRAELVDRLRADRLVESARVEAALRAVPRHLFLPGSSLEDAYADQPVVTKRAPDGTPRSSASQPAIVARMLEQLDVQPGDSVLEVGAGTGYNAALLTRLGAAVTTLDIDPGIAAEARSRLAPGTTVVCADGALGYPPNAPYDRLIVTAGAGDLSPAWLDQLTPTGRIVVPLRIRGLTRSIAFDRDGDRLTSRSMEVCGFIPMRGAGPDAERSIALRAKDVVLITNAQHPAKANSLAGVLDQPRVAVWTKIRLHQAESLEHLDLWLAALDGACRLFARRDAVEARLVAPAGVLGAAAVANDTSVGYLALRPHGRSELGCYAHGPDAQRLAERMATAIETWHRRGRPQARITAYPAATPDADLAAGPVIDTPHARLTLSWS